VVLGTGGIFTPATVPGASPRTAPSLDRTRDGAGGPSLEKTAPATCVRAGDWQLAKGRRRSEKQRGSGRRAPAQPSDETGRQVGGRRSEKQRSRRGVEAWDGRRRRSLSRIRNERRHVPGLDAGESQAGRGAWYEGSICIIHD